MANAAGECNAREGGEVTQNWLFSQPKPVNESESPLFRVGIRHFRGGVTDRPSRWARTDSSHLANRPLGVVAISSRLSDSRSNVVDHSTKARLPSIIGRKPAWKSCGRATKFVSLRALDVGQRKRALADSPSPVEHVPDGADVSPALPSSIRLSSAAPTGTG